jgi:translation initiation factor 1
MSRDADPLVYSTDGSHPRACPRCGRQPCQCPAAVALVPAATPLHVGLERKGRGGKAVTVVHGLPAGTAASADLLRQLKAHCGAGGTLKAETLEIQGDQRDRVLAFLARLGFPVQRAGG